MPANKKVSVKGKSDGNPCLKNQLEDLKTQWEDDVFGRYKEHKHKQLEESAE